MGHHLITTVSYYDDPADGSLPTPVYVGSTQVTNQRPTIRVPVTVTDVTGQESKYTLDTHGFQFHTHPTSINKDDFFTNGQVIKAAYYNECEELLKKITGATSVKAFDHKVRHGPAGWHSITSNNTQSRGPLHHAHVDQSYDGAEIRLRQVFPDRADELIKKRWQIINIWRPLSSPITQSPLALLDATSIPDTDLLPASIIYLSSASSSSSSSNRNDNTNDKTTATITSIKRNESWTVKHGKTSNHKWYFKYRQSPDEITLIKCFDSDPTQRARRTPHCAVEDPDEGRDEWRASVEVRFLVFYP